MTTDQKSEEQTAAVETFDEVPQQEMTREDYAAEVSEVVDRLMGYKV